MARQLDAPLVERAEKIALAESIRQLARLLRQENDALAQKDFACVGALLVAKHAAAEALAAVWHVTTTVDDSGEALRRLGILADENRLLVNRAMRVQRRILDLVSRAARDADKRR